MSNFLSLLFIFTSFFKKYTGTFDFNSTTVPFHSNETIIEVWTNTKYLSDVINAGYDGIYAAGWYLDRQQPVDNVVAWEWLDTMWQMYDIDPEADIIQNNNSSHHNSSSSSSSSSERVGRVLGGEASMWSEQVNALTLDGRMWPRACTVAERLWSNKDTKDHEYAAYRLRNHRCRMVKLGNIGAGPFWSDRCVGYNEIREKEYRE
jgi:hexosaminidase